MTTAAYVRLSRYLPDQTSTRRQLADIEGLAAVHRWGKVVSYEDVDLSAYKRGVRRPSYEQLLVDIAGGSIKRVVFWKLDRVARNIREAWRFLGVCEDHGVTVVSVKEQFDTSTTVGQIVVGLIAGFAQLESEGISTRVKSARKLEASEGRAHAGGYRRFGYTRTMEPVDVEAVAVRHAAGLILAGGSVTAIARQWNDDGLLSVGGKAWTPKMVASMLRSPHLAGLRRHLGEVVAEGTWPAILDRDTHYALVAALDGRPGARTGRARTYLLSGLLFCGRDGCGAPLIAHPQRGGVRAYWCSNKPGAGGCGRLSSIADPLEDLIRGYVFRALADKAVLRALRRPARVANAEEITALELRLDRVERTKDLLDPEDYGALVAGLETQLDQLRRDAARATVPAIAGLPSSRAAIEAWWADPDTSMEDRHTLTAMLFEKIILSPGQRGRKGFDPGRVPADNLVWRA